MKPLMFNDSRMFYGLHVGTGNNKVILTIPGEIKHSDPINQQGVPCFDVMPFINDYVSCYVHLMEPGHSTSLSVRDGYRAGERIFGVTNAGVSSSPDTVEILFYSASTSGPISEATATPYVWTSLDPTVINICYGYFNRVEQLSPNFIRMYLSATTLPQSFVQDQLLTVSGELIYIGDGDIVTKN